MKINSNLNGDIHNTFQAQMLYLGNQLSNRIVEIDDIGDYLPGSVMVQDFGRMCNMYMNRTGCDYLRHSNEELMAMGPEYFSRFFPMEEMIGLKRKLDGFVSTGDGAKLHSFFQRVRPDERSEYEWFLTTSRLMQAKDCVEQPRLIHVAVPMGVVGDVGRRIRNMVGEDEFFVKNYQRFNSLSLREKEIISYIVEGKSSMEIACLLYRSIHTVNSHRKNILQKLGVSSLAQLTKFAVCFELV